MAKDSGSGDSIYGHVPDAGAGKIASEALKDLAESSSNTINGPLTSKDSDYPEKE